MKNYIISLTHDIDQALEDINTIKESIDPENMVEGIPTCILIMITKEELDRKKEEDIFKGTRTIAVTLNFLKIFLYGKKKLCIKLKFI